MGKIKERHAISPTGSLIVRIDPYSTICEWFTDLHIVTWDFLGDMTFSKRMGFLEQGKDVDGILQTAEDVMRYFSVVGPSSHSMSM